MNVEKAIFGQVGQGHGLRSFSSSPNFFRKISQWLDLPDVVPAGVDFSPYISGFPFENKYILARSFVDENASRSGMIVVYALAIDIVDILSLDDLNSLIKLLPVETCSDHIFIESSVIVYCKEASLGINNGLNSTVVELLLDKRDGPVVHVGLKGFDALVCSIWFKLWPSMRKHFSFRLSVSPRDCVDARNPRLVCIPPSLISRWGNQKIIKDVSPITISPAIKAFHDGYNEFKYFCDLFEIEITDPSFLGFLIEAKTKFETHPLMFNDCLSLIRFIEVLSPYSSMGIDQKLVLLKKLASATEDTEVNNILKLRNFTGVGFSDLKIVWEAIVSKLRCENYSEVDDPYFIEIINNIYSEVNLLPDWKSSVQSGMKSALLSSNVSIFSAVWRWLQLDSEVALQFLNSVEINEDIEKLLSAYVKKDLPRKLVESLVVFCSSKKLLILHGSILSLYLPAQEAFKKQIEIDTEASYLGGLNSIAFNVDRKQLLSSCIYIDDVRLADIVTAMSADDPVILESVSASSDISLSIWTNALKLNPNLWNAPSRPNEILYSLLDESLMLGYIKHDDLINLLSKSPMSDLCDYPRVNEVWSLFDEVAKFNYLNNTAKGWYKRALMLNFITPGNMLQDAIYRLDGLREAMTKDSLKYNEGVIGIFSHIPIFLEGDFIFWLEYWLSNQKQHLISASESIGKIIINKKWVNAAKIVHEKSKVHSINAFSILRVCKSILPLRDRLDLGECTYEEKWNALKEVLINLYSSGPDENGIWERSGGNAWNIWSYGSGYERWTRAIDKVKNGSKPDVMDLLNKVSDDFPGNHSVNALKKIFKDER